MSKNQWNTLLNYLRFAGFALMFLGICSSAVLMSVSSFWLLGVWILEAITDSQTPGLFRQKVLGFGQKKGLLLFSSLYLCLLVSLIWSSDLGYAFWDIRIKVPMLFLPFVIATLRPMPLSWWRVLWGLFITALTLTGLVSVISYAGGYPVLEKYLGFKPRNFSDPRNYSLYISHIRYSLMLVFGVAVMLYYFSATLVQRAITIAISALFVLVIWIMASATGMITLFCVLSFWIYRIFIRQSSMAVRLSIIAVIFGLTAFSILSVRNMYTVYFTPAASETASLDSTTLSGEKYLHYPERHQLENGHYTMRYIAPNELSEAWSLRSKVPIKGLDESGDVLEGTLIRYLTSKGLRKDKEGVAQLTDMDVANIERGITNSNEEQMRGIRKRINQLFFEYSVYLDHINPSGHSATQRLEFWRAGWHIFQQNIWIGVGGGDVKVAFDNYYSSTNSALDEAHRHRAHNQFLTWFLTYGVFGGLFFLFVWVYIAFKNGTSIRFLKNTFLIIALLSFLTEDTLETQAGVAFVVFMLSCVHVTPAKEK